MNEINCLPHHIKRNSEKDCDIRLVLKMENVPSYTIEFELENIDANTSKKDDIDCSGQYDFNTDMNFTYKKIKINGKELTESPSFLPSLIDTRNENMLERPIVNIIVELFGNEMVSEWSFEGRFYSFTLLHRRKFVGIQMESNGTQFMQRENIA